MLKKRLKKIGISAFILLVLFMIAGFVDVYINDKTPTKTSSKSTALKYLPVKPPPKPGPNASVGVAEESFDTPVHPGSSTSMIVLTTSGATCNISVINQNGQSAFHLTPKIADAYGNVTWSWAIPNNTPVGSYPVKVTCRLGKNWAVYADTLIVTN